MFYFDREYLKPWVAARAFFESPDDEDSPTYWLSWARSIIGIITVVIASRPYRSPFTVLNEAWTKAALAALLGLVTLALLVPWAYQAAAPRGRSYMREGFPEFFKCLSMTGATLVAGFVLLRGNIWQGAGFFTDLFLTAVLLWFGIFGAIAAVLASRSVFRVSEVHPLLTPLSASAVGAGLFLSELIKFNTEGLPSDTWLILTLGGFASTTAIAVLELKLLWGEGHKFFGGPEWAIPPAPPPPLTDGPLSRLGDLPSSVWLAVIALAVIFVNPVRAFVFEHTAFVVISFLAIVAGRAFWDRGGWRIGSLFRGR
jgi:hypothetical protein